MQFGGCTYTKEIISFLNFGFTWCPLLPLAPRGSGSEGIQAHEAWGSHPGGCPAAPGPLTFLLPRRRCAHFTGLLVPGLGPSFSSHGRCPGRQGRGQREETDPSCGLPSGSPSTLLGVAVPVVSPGFLLTWAPAVPGPLTPHL